MDSQYLAPHGKSAEKRRIAGRNVAKISLDAESPERDIGRRIQVQSNGCWYWRGDGERYGSAIYHGKQSNAHRIVYEILVGEIPDGWHVHHECEHPGCVNPAHLIVLTPAEHMARHKELRVGQAG